MTSSGPQPRIRNAKGRVSPYFEKLVIIAIDANRALRSYESHLQGK